MHYKNFKQQNTNLSNNQNSTEPANKYKGHTFIPYIGPVEEHQEHMQEIWDTI